MNIVFRFNLLVKMTIQLRADAYVRLLNKPYGNDVTLREQNLT